MADEEHQHHQQLEDDEEEEMLGGAGRTDQGLYEDSSTPEYASPTTCKSTIGTGHGVLNIVNFELVGQCGGAVPFCSGSS